MEEEENKTPQDKYVALWLFVSVILCSSFNSGFYCYLYLCLNKFPLSKQAFRSFVHTVNRTPVKYRP